MSKISIPEVVDAFREYKKKNDVWGSLHIVLSDGNVRDSDVEFCVAWSMAKGDVEGERLAKILLGMSKTQRYKISYMC